MINNKILYGLVCILCIGCISIVEASINSDFLNLINEERVNVGKNPLVRNGQLEQAAMLHAQDMLLHNYLSHTSLDGRSFSQRIRNAGYNSYTAVGENIAYHSGPPDANKVFNMWKNSPGHYSNMIYSFNEEGLGFAYDGNRTYYVLDLGKRNGVITNNTNPPTNTTQPPVIPSNTTNSSNPQNPNINTTNISLKKPSASFKFSFINYTTYRKITIKANFSEPSASFYTLNNTTKRICSSCSRFYLTFKIPLHATLPIDFRIMNKAGQNATYSFNL